MSTPGAPRWTVEEPYVEKLAKEPEASTAATLIKFGLFNADG